jgi:hypothetical protein
MPERKFKKFDHIDFSNYHWYSKLRTAETRRMIYAMARRAGMSRESAIKVRDLSNRHASMIIKDVLRKKGKLNNKANTFIDKILPYKERRSKDAKGYFVCDPNICDICARAGSDQCKGYN